MFKSRRSLVLFSVLFALLFVAAPYGPETYACLWPAGRAQVGKRVEVEGVAAPQFVKNLVTHEERAFWERALADLERPRPAYLHHRNNLAVALIHLGRAREAIPVLEEAERLRPGEYFTAANLGTAYELAGDNRKALEWIKEGLNRNADSHFGTEWLHVKILEAKLALEEDADWLRKRSVLGADFRPDENTRQPRRLAADHLGREKSLAEIESALVYQLHERLEFVKPPDAVVADLLFDLSDVMALTRTAQHAAAVRELALSYGPEHENLVNGRPGRERRAAAPAASRPFLFYSAWAAAALLFACGLYFLFKRRRLREPRI